MKRINYKNGVILSVLLIIILTFIISFIFSEEITFWTILIRLPTAITIFGIMLIIFVKWLWKIWVFKDWLVLIPDLSGEWTGKLKTTYLDPKTGKTKKSKVIIAIVTQDLFHISINMKTKEMNSTSFVAAFDIDQNQNRNRICYSYTSRPKPECREQSPMHDGTALLDIIGNPQFKLIGEYWTTRKTTGMIILKKV